MHYETIPESGIRNLINVSSRVAEIQIFGFDRADPRELGDQ